MKGLNMEASNEVIKDNREMSTIGFEMSSVCLSKTTVFDRLINVMEITLPKQIETENLDCQTVAGLVEAFVRSEVKVLCDPISDVCFHQISYENIKQATVTVEAKRSFYSSIVGECESLFNEFYGSETENNQFNSCPVDSTIVVKSDGLWIQNLRDPMFVGYGNITTTFDLLRAVRCKFSYLTCVCDKIMDIRSSISLSVEACGLVFNSYCACHDEFVMISAQKYLDDNDYFTSPAKKCEKLQTKVMRRMTRSLLYPHYQDFLYNPATFAHHIANTEGVDNSIVADFLIDNEILNRMNNKMLQFPWLKSEYHNRAEGIKLMLSEAYVMCMSPYIKKTPTQTYTLLWYWLLDHLRMAVSGKDNGVAMFTELLNRVTGATVLASTMPKEISNNKKTDYSAIYNLLDAFAVKYGFLTLK